MSSVTIGGQTFVKSGNGWIDKKTKQPAPEGLDTLLNNVAEEESPEGKRKRVRVDPGRPVIKLGSSEYVYDFNGKTWIDKKTKDPANPNFSRIIEGVFQGLDEWVGADGDIYDKSTLDPESRAKQKSEQAKSIINNMGSTGQAGKQKVRKPTGGGQFVRPNVKINSPIIRMIEKLSVIDGYLKQRLANDMATSNSQIVAAKEQAIEQSDAMPNLKEENVDAEVEKTNKESQAILVAGAIAAGALLLTQLDPVKETFNSIVGFAKGVYNFASDIVGVINEGLVRIVGTPESRGEQTSDATGTPTSDARRSSDMSPSAGVGGEAEDGTAFSGPGQTASGNQTSGGSATPEEILTAFPGPTSSPTAERNTTGSSAASAAASTTNATRVSSPATSTSAAPSTSAKPVASTQTFNDILSAYNNSAGKLSNDPAIRDKAFSTAPKTNNQPAAAPAATGSIPKNDIVALGNYLVGQGAEKGKMEHLALSGRVGEHSKNSRHYRGMAIDVNFPGPNEASILDALEPQLRAAGYNTIWRKKDHYTHMHVSVGGPEGGGSGDSYGSGESTLQKVATAGVELTKGAMESIATILRAGLGPMTPTSGSQLSTVNDTMSGNIARAARERTATVAATKTPESVATTRSDPMNLNASTGSSTIQNMPTASDKAGVDFYLTRMGFPKISYKQNAYAGMRA
jgi:hypothetical protein